jgi:hypothetical protein
MYKKIKILSSELELKEILIGESDIDLEKIFAIDNDPNYEKLEIYQMVPLIENNALFGIFYNWKIIQSKFSDNSSLGNYHSNSETKGEAISRMLEAGFIVEICGKRITPLS